MDKYQPNPKKPSIKPSKNHPKPVKKLRANRSLEKSFCDEELRNAGKSIRAFDPAESERIEFVAQQQFLDSLSGSNFTSIATTIPKGPNKIRTLKAINFPSIDFPTPRFSRDSEYETLNVETDEYETFNVDNSLIRKMKYRSEKAHRQIKTSKSILYSASKRKEKENMDLTTMNLAALSSLNEAESGLTEKSTNIGVDDRSKRVEYCSELKASQKLSKNKKIARINQSKKIHGVIKKRDEPRSSQLVNSRKSENRPIQVQEKYKVSENARKSYQLTQKFESISSIQKCSPVKFTQKPAAPVEPTTREAISRSSREHKIVKKFKAMLQVKNDQIKKLQETIFTQKTDGVKLQVLVKSKDETIKVQNEKIKDLTHINGRLYKEVAELNKAIKKLGVSTDSGFSASKSNISDTSNLPTVETQQRPPTTTTTTEMAKTKSGEFLAFSKKLSKFYQKSVQNKNKDNDPLIAKLIKNMKSSKHEKRKIFDSFVSGLAKKQFAVHVKSETVKNVELNVEDQLRKKYVKNVAEHVKKGLKNKDPKFAGLRAKMKKLKTVEEKKEYLKKFVEHQAEKQLEKNKK